MEKQTSDLKLLILIHSVEAHRMTNVRRATGWRKVAWQQKSETEEERADWSMPALVRVYFLWVEVGVMSDCQTTQRAAQPDTMRETYVYKATPKSIWTDHLRLKMCECHWIRQHSIKSINTWEEHREQMRECAWVILQWDLLGLTCALAFMLPKK